MNSILKLSIGFIILSLMATVFICLRKIKKTDIDKLQDVDFVFEKTKSDMAQKALKQMIHYEGFAIDTTWVLRNYEKRGLLSDYIKQRPALILFYPNHFCHECFEGDLYRFNEVCKRHIGRAFILSTQLTNREMYLWGKEQGAVADALQINPSQKKLFTEIEEPCFFVLTEDMQVRLFFNPAPDLPELSDWFFEKAESILKQTDHKLKK